MRPPPTQSPSLYSDANIRHKGCTYGRRAGDMLDALEAFGACKVDVQRCGARAARVLAAREAADVHVAQGLWGGGGCGLAWPLNSDAGSDVGANSNSLAAHTRCHDDGVGSDGNVGDIEGRALAPRHLRAGRCCFVSL
jgi:hypothetical protein